MIILSFIFMLGNVPPLRFFREGEEAFSQSIQLSTEKEAKENYLTGMIVRILL
jgi:hypothetical protein